MSGVKVLVEELRSDGVLSGWCAYQGQFLRFWTVGKLEDGSRLVEIYRPTQEELVGWFLRIQWEWKDGSAKDHEPLYTKPAGELVGVAANNDLQFRILKGDGTCKVT